MIHADPGVLHLSEPYAGATSGTLRTHEPLARRLEHCDLHCAGAHRFVGVIYEARYTRSGLLTHRLIQDLAL